MLLYELTKKRAWINTFKSIISYYLPKKVFYQFYRYPVFPNEKQKYAKNY